MLRASTFSRFRCPHHYHGYVFNCCGQPKVQVYRWLLWQEVHNFVCLKPLNYKWSQWQKIKLFTTPPSDNHRNCLAIANLNFLWTSLKSCAFWNFNVSKPLFILIYSTYERAIFVTLFGWFYSIWFFIFRNIVNVVMLFFCRLFSKHPAMLPVSQ